MKWHSPIHVTFGNRGKYSPQTLWNMRAFSFKLWLPKLIQSKKLLISNDNYQKEMLELKNNLDIINEIKHICELNAFSLKNISFK